MAWNLLVLVSYGNGFSRLDLDGNKAAKDKCFTRKMRDKEVLSSSTEGHQFSFLEFKSALQELSQSFLFLPIYGVMLLIPTKFNSGLTTIGKRLLRA